jgi:hypothetical protein
MIPPITESGGSQLPAETASPQEICQDLADTYRQGLSFLTPFL